MPDTAIPPVEAGPDRFALGGPLNPDSELLAISDYQLRMFEALDLFPTHHVSRVTDHVSFPKPGEQQCRREMQLRLPALSPVEDEDSSGPFIVSLGQFRRRRLPDLRVTDGHGVAVNLLSRRQHGHVLAIALLRPHFTADEWREITAAPQLRASLNALREHLSRFLTSIVPNEDFTAAGAAELLSALLAGVRASVGRMTVEVAAFELRCEESVLATRHLCWVDALPGTLVQLHASWTQPEAPQPSHDSPTDTAPAVKRRRRRRSLRLRWRDFRNRQYTRAKMMPLRYAFATPAYTAAGSYYFALTPPDGTEVLLLDWDYGFRVAVDETSLPATPTTELESATWSYHFHNYRLTQRRRQRDRRRQRNGAALERRTAQRDRRQRDQRKPHGKAHAGPERRQGERRTAERRLEKRRRPERRRQERRGGQTAALIQVFVRGEQNDNGKLFAIGLLSLALAIIAGRGTLQAGAGENASQLLLLAPATLVLIVDQQSHHHFASMTRFYRLVLWLYIVLSLLFAASVTFSVTSLPFLEGDISTDIPRYASGTFALASGLLALAFAWAGRYFAWSTLASYRRVSERVRLFGTASVLWSWLAYKWRRRHRRREAPVSDPELKQRRRELATHEIYAKVARHNADLVALVAFLAAAAAIVAMFRGHWGEGEACAITRVHAEHRASLERRALLHVHCEGGVTKYTLGPKAA